MDIKRTSNGKNATRVQNIGGGSVSPVNNYVPNYSGVSVGRTNGTVSNTASYIKTGAIGDGYSHAGWQNNVSAVNNYGVSYTSGTRQTVTGTTGPIAGKGSSVQPSSPTRYTVTTRTTGAIRPTPRVTTTRIVNQNTTVTTRLIPKTVRVTTTAAVSPVVRNSSGMQIPQIPSDYISTNDLMKRMEERHLDMNSDGKIDVFDVRRVQDALGLKRSTQYVAKDGRLYAANILGGAPLGYNNFDDSKLNTEYLSDKIATDTTVASKEYVFDNLGVPLAPSPVLKCYNAQGQLLNEVKLSDFKVSTDKTAAAKDGNIYFSFKDPITDQMVEASVPRNSDFGQTLRTRYSGLNVALSSGNTVTTNRVVATTRRVTTTARTASTVVTNGNSYSGNNKYYVNINSSSASGSNLYSNIDNVSNAVVRRTNSVGNSSFGYANVASGLTDKR